MLIAHRTALAVHRRSASARSIIDQPSSIFVSIRATPFAPAKIRKNWQNQNEPTARLQKPFQRLAIATFRASRARFLTERTQTRRSPAPTSAHTFRYAAQFAQHLPNLLNASPRPQVLSCEPI
ncbi:MAG TPA: hypothetical protein VGP94_13085 [Tepidisphaeraceae bacterium]|jgi:hypothetical protein|nr:hypothetical protein [Tepidisphaeraceae bacterium]